MAPLSALKKKRRRQEAPQQDELEELLLELEAHMALDRILEARKVVDQIQAKTSSVEKISRKRQEEMQHVIDESDHVMDMLRDLKSNEGWILSSHRKGITVHYRHEEGTSIHSVKTHCILQDFTPTDFLHLCCLFAEMDLLPKWFPNHILDSVNMLAVPSKYRYVYQMLLKFHFLPIQDREIIAEGVGYHLRNPSAFFVLAKSIDSSPHCEIPPTPPRTVRMETKNAFYVEILPGNKVTFSQIAHDNPKIRLVPAFVLNYLSQGAIPFDLLQNLRHCVRNFEGSEWEKRIAERRDFYGEIEDRIKEEVDMVEHVEVAKNQKETTPAPPEKLGLSFYKAALIYGVLLAICAWSFQHYRLPFPAYVALLEPPMVVLTYLVYIHHHYYL